MNCVMKMVMKTEMMTMIMITMVMTMTIMMLMTMKTMVMRMTNMMVFDMVVSAAALAIKLTAGERDNPAIVPSMMKIVMEINKKS